MKITKVLLAAGQSSRFGQCKLTQQLGDMSIVKKAVQMLNSVNNEPTYVISGAWHHEVHGALEDTSYVEVMYNKQWQKGLGNSIAFAAKKLGQSDRALLFVLADQVALTSDDLKKLVSGFKRQPTRWCARYNQCLGVPAIFPPEDNVLLSALSGEHGAKKLLRDTTVRTQFLSMPRATVDVDTLDDLVNARRLLAAGCLESNIGQCV
ncbi:nucleotidyltransferase family protein [Vibrio alginolyticus]|nr:nucleotidyltransferase family protein [Vibrio alginolyticus]